MLISQVAANSPAESGGLLVGDVIVGFGGEAIEDAESLVTRLRGNKVGTAVPITVIRGTYGGRCNRNRRRASKT